jgi:hydroxyversicolorone monooxygenase
MQPHAKHLDVFVRTPVWFVQIANNYGANHEYTDEQRATFHKDPTELVKHAKSIEDQVNGLWGMFYKNSQAQAIGQEMMKARMAEFIKDERLLKGFTPKWGIGCRRVTPGDPYMTAIQKPNVDVHFTAVNKITEDGVVGEDGVERKVDTIVCATGFDVSYRPRFPIVGQNGTDLADKWKVCPEGYLGLGIPEFPNFLTFIGPNWPVENVSMPLWIFIEPSKLTCVLGVRHGSTPIRLDVRNRNDQEAPNGIHRLSKSQAIRHRRLQRPLPRMGQAHRLGRGVPQLVNPIVVP